MKLHTFTDLEKDIAAKSAYLEKQRQLLAFERVRLKQAWVAGLTSPPALLFSLSTGFVTAYLWKSRAGREPTRGRFSTARTKLQTAIFNSIKRFTSGIVIGLISSITARRSEALSTAGQEEYLL